MAHNKRRAVVEVSSEHGGKTNVADAASVGASRAVVMSCEHGGYEIPRELRSQLSIPQKVLTSHRGYDAGSLKIASALAEHLGIALIAATTTRLVVDLNRSEGNGAIFSTYTKQLSGRQREIIFDRYYRPYRARVRAAVDAQLAGGKQVLHISVHTFTPVLRGQRRSADVGLLFDPDRPEEVKLAQTWAESLRQADPSLLVKMNYPYLGIDDGHTTQLRTMYPDPLYAGIELEVNQKWVRGSARRFADLLQTLRKSIGQVASARNPASNLG